MTHGHLIALKDAPILSHDALSVVAYWAEDMRGASFAESVAWDAVRPLTYGMPAGHSGRYSAALVFARGPLQIWQMAEPVKADDLERVFAGPLFRRAPGPFLNDPVRVRTACLTLLNARDYRLSRMVEDEIGRLAAHLSATGRPPQRIKETTT